MAHYVVLIEKAEHNYSVCVPDVPGCVTTGATLDEVERNIKEALAFHFEGLLADGDPIPQPSTIAATVDVPLPAVSA